MSAPDQDDRLTAARLWKNAWLLLPLLVPVVLLVGRIQGPAAAILVLVAAALVAVIALFWASLRTLLGETALSGADAYAIAAPRAEEEQKQAVLRALKDLEFERSVGKISEEDYAAQSAMLRQEAKRLLRVIDEGARPGRERVESLVHERLVAAGLAEPLPGSSEAPRDASKAKKPGKKKKGKAGSAPAPETERRVEIVSADEAGAPGPGNESTWKSSASAGASGKRPQGEAAASFKTMESAAYVAVTKVCADCGVKNDADANFCKKCGSKRFEEAGGAGEKALAEKAEAPAEDTSGEGRADSPASVKEPPAEESPEEPAR